MFNEFQAKDYNEKHGMTITGVRPANVTGPDKVRGSVDHVNSLPSRRAARPISFPFADAMRCPIHVDDIAEVFARVLMKDKPATASTTPAAQRSAWAIWRISCAAICRMRRSVSTRNRRQGTSGNYLIDNRRLVEEFGVQYRPYQQRVLQIINEVRAQRNQPPIAG